MSEHHPEAVDLRHVKPPTGPPERMHNPRRQEARNRAGMIRNYLQGLWPLIAKAYREQDWLALGYDSWDDYVAGEFDTARWKVHKAERAPVVTMLRSAGMSTRAIAAATGESQSTVQRAVAGESNGSPERVTGRDSRSYPAAGKPAPKSNRAKFDEALERAKAKHADRTVAGEEATEPEPASPDPEPGQTAAVADLLESAASAERAVNLTQDLLTSRVQLDAAQLDGLAARWQGIVREADRIGTLIDIARQS